MHTKRIAKPRKRQDAEQQSLATSPKQTNKKQAVDYPRGSLLPAAFWDNLSQIWLTHNALRELDRRNKQITPDDHIKSGLLRPVTRFMYRNIQAVAKQGGPDLSDLKGCPEPKMALRRSKRKVQKPKPTPSASKSTSQDSGTLRSGNPSTNKSSETSSDSKSSGKPSKNSGPHDRNFRQHLTDHGVYPREYVHSNGRVPTKPKNWSGIRKTLARPRSSLSSSKFTDEMYQKFVRTDAHAHKEKQTEELVIPLLEGDVGDVRCTAGGIPSRNLAPLTDGTLVPGNPDHYYGALPEDLDRRIRNELDNQLVPTSQDNLPIAPNFFLAVKGRDGSVPVAENQATYEGALGARGIHSLREYGKDKSDFDGNAYTLTSTYQNGQLLMFTSHPDKSNSSDQTEYYLTQIKGWSMIGDADTFREAATWYRNGRDWAKEQRDKAIKDANTRLHKKS